jgi:hypothetical protein
VQPTLSLEKGQPPFPLTPLNFLLQYFLHPCMLKLIDSSIFELIFVECRARFRKVLKSRLSDSYTYGTDIETGSWKKVSNQTKPATARTRFDSSTVPTANGKSFMMFGIHEKNATIYDPNTETFSPTNIANPPAHEVRVLLDVGITDAVSCGSGSKSSDGSRRDSKSGENSDNVGGTTS